MSLAFLAKKSWHTANLRNVEKVWIAEQKHEAEEKKLVELRKNIEDERQLQELRALQAAHGDKKASIQRVDWLYEHPLAEQEKSAEEYLLGKEFLAPVAQGQGRIFAPESSVNAVNTTNEAFSRLHEDPMMLIKKQQKEMHESILKNPVKMKRIKEKVEKLLKERKEIKKEKKRKSAKIKKARKASYDEDSRSPIQNYGKRSRCLSVSRKRRSSNDKRCASLAVYRDKILRDRRRSRSSQRRNRSRSTSAKASYKSRRQYKQSRSRSRSPRLHVDEFGRQHRTRSRSRKQYTEKSNEKRLRTESTGSYGLKNASKSRKCLEVDQNSLGPNTKLLVQARDRKRKEKEEIQRKLARSTKHEYAVPSNVSGASDMVRNALEREKFLEQEIKRKEESVEPAEIKSDGVHFLRKLHEDAYMRSNEDLESKLRRNAHYIQKPNAEDGFL